MICSHCGTFMDNNEIVCPSCGSAVQSKSAAEKGAQAIRQGKRAREQKLSKSIAIHEKEIQKRRRRSGASHSNINSDKKISNANDKLQVHVDSMFRVYSDEQDLNPQEDGFDRRNRPIYSEEFISNEEAEAYIKMHAREAKKLKKHMVNWIKVWLITFVFSVILVIGIWLFLKNTDAGQRIMARLGRDANSTALWAVGEEKLDKGDISGAIAEFEKAKSQDELMDVVDVDGLLLLGSAYEAEGMTDEAATLYEQIYLETPSRSEAYVNHIRILLASNRPGDQAKAGELMKLAYDKTGEKSFNTQRNDLLPAAPEVDLTAGYYEQKKYIAITSYQGYDVYYTFDENAELPSGGTRFTERIFLDEGIHTLRAVAVNGELVSDVLTGTYKIIMPSPQTPRANLAPNTYKNRQNVKLKPGLDNMEDNDIVIYYTIDGSPPDADSPVFNGDPIWLPGGMVTLKAVAVNKYSKVSNTLEILYKIEAKPWPLSSYSSADTISGIKLFSTTMAEFQKQYGEGTDPEDVELPDIDTPCRKYKYDWGYVVMSKARTGWVVAELYFTSKFKGPRGTGIGDTESYVVNKYRDMGQVSSPSGNRGLYYNNNGTGKILQMEDGSRIIRYRCYVESHTWQLDYILDKNGNVFAIDTLYLP